MAGTIYPDLHTSDFYEESSTLTKEQRDSMLGLICGSNYHDTDRHICPLRCTDVGTCYWPHCRVIVKAMACIKRFPPDQLDQRFTFYEYSCREYQRGFGMYAEVDIKHGEYLFPLIGTTVDHANVLGLRQAIEQGQADAQQIRYVLQLKDGFWRCDQYRDARSLFWKYLPHNEHGANCTAFVCKDRQGGIMVNVRARVAIPKNSELAINFREHARVPGFSRECHCADRCRGAHADRKYRPLIIPELLFTKPKEMHNL